MIDDIMTFLGCWDMLCADCVFLLLQKLVSHLLHQMDSKIIPKTQTLMNTPFANSRSQGFT